MQSLRLLLVASLTAATTLNAAGKPVAPSAPICTETQVFGSKFGATEIQGKTVSSGLNSVVVELADSWAPFRMVEIGVTRRSKRIWSGSAIIAAPDPQQARELLSILRSRLEQALPISDQQVDRLGRVTLYSGSQLSSPTEPGEARYHIDGLKIELSANTAGSNTSLFVSCTDLKQEIQHVREALGK
jgi:hypothetical protein